MVLARYCYSECRPCAHEVNPRRDPTGITVIADSFRTRPAYLTVPTSEASATMLDAATLQLVVLDGVIVTLRPADCARRRQSF